MAISSSYNFATSRNEIIAGALRILGVIGEGDTPSTNQYTTGAEALNMLVKAWENDGLPIWLIKKQQITLISGTNTYAIGEGQTTNVGKPLKIYQAFYHDTASAVDIPMTSLSQQEYNMLSNKTIAGRPIQFYYEALRSYGNLYTFPTPDANAASDGSIYILYQSPFSDFDGSTDEPDVPQEFYRALKYALANDLAFEYGYPSKDRQDLERRSEQYKAQAFSFNQEEESFNFQIDRRNY